MSYHHGGQQPDSGATTAAAATRSIRNPNNLTSATAAAPAATQLQGFREDYHGHGHEHGEDDFDADVDADGSDDEVAQALRGQGEHMYHYATAGSVQQQQHYYDDRDYQGMGVDGQHDKRMIREEDEDEEEEDEDEDVAGEFSDSLSSSPSIPDDDIDFNLVYALHTFLATVDGQASVVKGDKLLLLDDSNSYWWLVRVLKTQAIGYIPAENIETPWERLARLNKHRNVDLTTATQHDVLTGPTSSSAQTRFAGRIPPSEQPHPHESRHPYSKGVPASPSHKDHPRNISPPAQALSGVDGNEYGEPEGGGGGGARPPSSKAKTVLFTAPTYYAHSATGLTSEDDEEGEGLVEEGYYEGSGDEMELEEEEGHEHVEGDELRRLADDDGRPDFKDDDFVGDHDHEGGQGVDEHRHEHDADIEDADQEPAEDDSTTLVLGQPVGATASSPPETRSDLPAALIPGGGARAALQAGRMVLESEPASRDGRTPLAEVDQRQLATSLSSSSANGPAGLGIGLGGGGGGGSFDRTGTTASMPLGKDGSAAPNATVSTLLAREFNENELLDPEAPTKKLSATPAIAREINRGPVSSGTFSASSAPTPNPFGPDSTSTTGTATADRPKRTIRGVEVVDPRDPRYNRMLQPTKQAGEDLVYERVVADAQRQQQQYHEQQYQLQQRRQMQQQQQQQQQAAFGNAGPNAASTQYETPDLHDEEGGDPLGDSTNSQRASLSDAGSGSEKKRKSGGGILGLFRKKDKKKKGAATTEDEASGKPGRRPSEESLRSSTSSGGAAFRRSSSGSPSGFRSSSDRPPNGSRSSGAGGSASTAESMFSTDAALRQQELEAKQALYQQYGVSRGPGDVSNTMTPRGMPGGLVMSQGGQQQQQQQGRDASPGPQSRLGASGSSTSNRNSLSLLSHPASMLGGSTGMASGSALNSPNSLAPPHRTRPGSLVGSPVASGVEVPLLSVMRVFAGENVDSDATFKTVLLNQSTSSAELVKQAMQRFRLTAPHLHPDEFYLTVKELGGDERPLDAEERPLEIFEDLSERIGDEGLALPPNVKRSSIGSINSISSNLTLNPAITRSGVGDWSDDSAVKFYLHRRQPAQLGNSLDLDRSHGSDAASRSTSEHGDVSLNSSGGSGPSYRFAVRLILPDEELPEHLAFDPLSEAVIPKTLLAERKQRLVEGTERNGPRQRIIFFPRNANVSEVVETALDRFGIADGVVDGGDEVEERVTRRRSSNRVKYILAVEREGQGESFLSSSSKLLDAYSIPPAFKAYDRSSREFRRRSADAGLILGLSSDVLPTDPVFVIRRSPHRSSASRGSLPQTVDELDELRQRRRVSSDGTRSSPHTSDSGARPSARELITAQRAASQANQRALLADARQDDLTNHSQTTLRADDPSADDFRYSILSEGSSVDAGVRPEALQGLGLRPTDNLSRGVSAADSFQTAQTSLDRTPLASPGVDDDEAAIAQLRAAEVGIPSAELTSAAAIGASRSASASPRPLSPTGLEESLQERLDRVLARVREDKARRAASPTPPPAGQRPQSYIDSSSDAGASGRFSPVQVTTRSASALGGRRSPFGDKLSDSPSIVGQLMSSPPRRSASSEHPAQIKKGSVASMSSTGSTATGTDQLSTPIASSNAHSTGYTPASSATGTHRAPLIYPDDYGYNFLAAVVGAGAQSSAIRRRPEPRAFYERAPDFLADAHPEVRRTYEEPARALSDIETRLDQLLVRLVNV